MSLSFCVSVSVFCKGVEYIHNSKDRSQDRFSLPYSYPYCNNSSAITIFMTNPNFQSLLLSQYSVFTTNDYKMIDTNNNDSDNEGSIKSDDVMNMGLYVNVLILITASFCIRDPTPQKLRNYSAFSHIVRSIISL